jgi:hypothetical protein
VNPVNAGNLTVSVKPQYGNPPNETKYVFTLTTNQLSISKRIVARPDTFTVRPCDGTYNSQTDLVYEMLLWGINAAGTPVVHPLTVVNNVATFEWPYASTFTCYAQARLRLTGAGQDTTEYAYSNQIKLNPYHYAGYPDAFWQDLNAITEYTSTWIPNDEGYNGSVKLYTSDGTPITDNAWEPGCYIEAISPAFLPYGRFTNSHPEWADGSYQLIRTGVGLQATDKTGKVTYPVLPLPSRYNVKPTVMSGGPPGTPSAGVTFRYYPKATELGSTFKLVYAPYLAQDFISWSKFGLCHDSLKLEGVTFKKPEAATAYRVTAGDPKLIPTNPNPDIFWDKNVASYQLIQNCASGPFAGLSTAESADIPSYVIDQISTDDYDLGYNIQECDCPFGDPGAGCSGVQGATYNVISGFTEEYVNQHRTLFWTTVVRLYMGTPQEMVFTVTSPTLGMPGNPDTKLPPPPPNCPG